MIDWEKRAREALGGGCDYMELRLPIAAALAQAYGEGLGAGSAGRAETFAADNAAAFWYMASEFIARNPDCLLGVADLDKLKEQKPRFSPALEPVPACGCLPCKGVRSAPFLAANALRPGIDRVPSCPYNCAMCERINKEPAR